MGLLLRMLSIEYLGARFLREEYFWRSVCLLVKGANNIAVMSKRAAAVQLTSDNYEQDDRDSDEVR